MKYKILLILFFSFILVVFAASNAAAHDAYRGIFIDPPGYNSEKIKQSIFLNAVTLHQDMDDPIQVGHDTYKQHIPNTSKYTTIPRGVSPGEGGIYGDDPVAELVLSYKFTQKKHPEMFDAVSFEHNWRQLGDPVYYTDPDYFAYGKVSYYNWYETPRNDYDPPIFLYSHIECTPPSDFSYEFTMVEADYSPEASAANAILDLAGAVGSVGKLGIKIVSGLASVTGFAMKMADLADDELGETKIKITDGPGSYGNTLVGAKGGVDLEWTIVLEELDDPNGECAGSGTTQTPVDETDGETKLFGFHVDQFIDQASKTILLSQNAKLEPGTPHITEDEFERAKADAPKEVLGFVEDVFEGTEVKIGNPEKKNQYLALQTEAKQLVSAGMYDSALNSYRDAFHNLILGFDEPSAAIPPWVKNVAGFWADGLISDREYALAFAFLAQRNIIKVANVEMDPQGAIVVSENVSFPKWTRNNAGWFADDKISEQDFVLGVEFLFKDIISFEEKSPVKALEIDPEMYKAAYVAMVWKQVALASLLEMANYQSKILDDESDRLWNEHEATGDIKLMNQAIKVQSASKEAKKTVIQVDNESEKHSEKTEQVKRDVDDALGAERAAREASDELEDVSKITTFREYGNASDRIDDIIKIIDDLTEELDNPSDQNQLRVDWAEKLGLSTNDPFNLGIFLGPRWEGHITITPPPFVESEEEPTTTTPTSTEPEDEGATTPTPPNIPPELQKLTVITVVDKLTQKSIGGAQIHIVNQYFGTKDFLTPSNGVKSTFLVDDTYYSITVKAAGYEDHSGTIVVKGETRQTIELNPISETPPSTTPTEPDDGGTTTTPSEPEEETELSILPSSVSFTHTVDEDSCPQLVAASVTFDSNKEGDWFVHQKPSWTDVELHAEDQRADIYYNCELDPLATTQTSGDVRFGLFGPEGVSFVSITLNGKIISSDVGMTSMGTMATMGSDAPPDYWQLAVTNLSFIHTVGEDSCPQLIEKGLLAKGQQGTWQWFEVPSWANVSPIEQGDNTKTDALAEIYFNCAIDVSSGETAIHETAKLKLIGTDGSVIREHNIAISGLIFNYP